MARIRMAGFALVGLCVLSCSAGVTTGLGPVAIRASSGMGAIGGRSAAPATSPKPVTSDKAHTYSLPLVVTENAECGFGSAARYTITADGLMTRDLRKLGSGSPAPAKLSSRQLTTEERDGLLALLTELNLATKALGNLPADPHGSTTTSCSSAYGYRLKVDGAEQTFGSNERRVVYEDSYVKAIGRLADALSALAEAEASPRPEPSESPVPSVSPSPSASPQ